ncbi:hypothetical protein VKS41_009389 [Umbelopsis sp. WA50703]
MDLHGSCHCGKTSFDVVSQTPAPFMHCYCSICRKCQGGGGYTINIMGIYDTLKLHGEKYMKTYQAIIDKSVPKKDQELCGNVRYFCGECGSHLFAYSKEWPENVYPYASAIDTPLPEPKPEDVYRLMLNKESKCNWATTPKVDNKRNFSVYPDCSLEDWHKARNQFIERK